MKTVETKLNLKERVLKILSKKGFSFSDLATHLGIKEKELEKRFLENSIEIRMLELISKELRIPLYSFFRDDDFGFDYSKQPYYTERIWSENESSLKKEITSLRKEVEELKISLGEKDLLIEALERELKSKI